MLNRQILRKNITIKSRKFDNQIHKKWNADLIEITNTLLIFKGVFENEITHKFLGVIRAGTISYEFYWSDRWYNVFRFHEPDGKFRNFYCNINTPPTFKNGVLDYIDLDIDVVVWKDFSPIVLDHDEFTENSFKYNYSRHILTNTKSALRALLKNIEDRKFPFDNHPNINPDTKSLLFKI